VRQCSSSFKVSCMRPTERSGLSEVEYRVIRALAKYNPYSTNESSEVKEVEYMIDPSLPPTCISFVSFV
jgi:hypothetical protein